MVEAWYDMLLVILPSVVDVVVEEAAVAGVVVEDALDVVDNDVVAVVEKPAVVAVVVPRLI